MPRVSEDYKQRRRQEIIDAAHRCFARQGFHATSMDDLIQASGTSPSVMYRWFRGKDELVAAVVAQALGGIVGTMAALRAAKPTPTLPDALREILATALHITAKDGRELSALPLQAWTEALRNPVVSDLVVHPYQQLLDGFADLIQKNQEQGALSSDANPGDLARPVFALIPGYMLQNLLIGPVDPDRYIEAVKSLIG